VKTLAETRKQSPLTIDILVGSIKRYVARPEFRIRLDEVITQEVNKLFDRLDAKELSPQGGPLRNSADALNSMRPLPSRSRKPLVFSDDGDDAELALIADTIRGVVARANKVGSGLNIWLDLRTYPAVLLMTAYGLGLARAERWKTCMTCFLSRCLGTSGTQNVS
jgi:hypothetical protein